MNDIAAATFQGNPPASNDTVGYFNLLNRVGLDVGKVTRYIIDYENFNDS
jgi:hypothetical protein